MTSLPNEPESYVHRIGRTARAGAEGIAISFCSADERAYLRDIERLIRRKLDVVGEVPEDLSVPMKNTKGGPRRPGTGFKKRRRSRRPSRRAA